MTNIAQIVRAAAITRPADTIAYASGDLVANSTTAGSVTPFEFKNVTLHPNSTLRIEAARLISSSTSVTNASFRLHIFTQSPVSAAGDNAAFSCPIVGYVGALDITIDRAFSDGAFGRGVPTVGGSLLIQGAEASTTLYGLLEARATYAPTSGGTFTPILETYRL